MAQRPRAGTLSGPHSVSLKVLRLSRPSLATQTSLPRTQLGDGRDIAGTAAIAYPSALGQGETLSKQDERSLADFPLTPLLTLPAAFGAAYVGEAFSCTLCTNCEVSSDGVSGKVVSDVSIVAEMQCPGKQDAVKLELVHSEHEEEQSAELAYGATIQRTIRYELKDEGPHVLAVTVTYTEKAAGTEAPGRTRTFRKLYQFVAQQLIAVRSKVTERKMRGPAEKREWTLEAQLENVGEASVVVEKVWLKERDGITSLAVNVDDKRDAVVLKPQDVEQVMFLVREEKSQEAATVAGRTQLGQLNVNWRSAMGEKGSLVTGWLASRGR